MIEFNFAPEKGKQWTLEGAKAYCTGYKNGRWIENGVFKYCPNCGAKMEVEP